MRAATLFLSGLLVVLGAAVVVETALVGGRLGFLLGGLLLVAGALRLVLTLRVRD